MAEDPTKLLVALFCDRLEHHERDLMADRRCRLQQALPIGRQPIDTGREDGADRRRHLDGVNGPSKSIGPALARDHLRLDQSPHALLQKEWIALGTLDEQSLQGIEARIAAEECAEDLFDALSRQWVDAELAVVGLAAPTVLILGAIVDQQENARRRQAFH